MCLSSGSIAEVSEREERGPLGLASIAASTAEAMPAFSAASLGVGIQLNIFNLEESNELKKIARFDERRDAYDRAVPSLLGQVSARARSFSLSRFLLLSAFCKSCPPPI